MRIVYLVYSCELLQTTGSCARCSGDRIQTTGSWARYSGEWLQITGSFYKCTENANKGHG